MDSKAFFKNIFTCLFLCTICTTNNGQNVSLGNIIKKNQYDPVYNPISTPASGKSRDFLPVSPTVGSLGVFGQIPVGNYTGTADINMPLYTTIKYKEDRNNVEKLKLYLIQNSLTYANTRELDKYYFNSNEELGKMVPASTNDYTFIDYRGNVLYETDIQNKRLPSEGYITLSKYSICYHYLYKVVIYGFRQQDLSEEKTKSNNK